MASAPAAPPLELDSRAWERCVSILHRELSRIASREDCQDAVQEALADALRQPGLSVENLDGWVLAIARRRVLDHHRATVGRGKDARGRRTFVAAEAEDLADQRVSDTELVELLEDGASRDASEAMKRLSAEHQRLLTLSIERTSYRDVGAILGVSSKAAKERTHRAWSALRQAFIETERGPECKTVRRMLVGRRTRGTAGVTERKLLIAHVETCAPCRAYEKRMKGLIATSPAPTLPFWQQILLRLEQFLVGAPGPRSVESAAASALSNGGTGGLARMLATLCAGATAAGMCAVAVIPSNHSAQRPRAQVPRATPTVAPVRATATAISTPTAAPTRTPLARKRAKARSRPKKDEVTGNVARDTRSATKSRPASAPSGSTSTSEFAPSGGGSTATSAAAPAPAVAGGEFRP
jgi:RNA polymerase sigma factor (sigma-70 family)